VRDDLPPADGFSPVVSSADGVHVALARRTAIVPGVRVVEIAALGGLAAAGEGAADITEPQITAKRSVRRIPKSPEVELLAG
jgi:hypothetical protein